MEVRCLPLHFLHPLGVQLVGVCPYLVQLKHNCFLDNIYFLLVVFKTFMHFVLYDYSIQSKHIQSHINFDNSTDAAADIGWYWSLAIYVLFLCYSKGYVP